MEVFAGFAYAAPVAAYLSPTSIRHCSCFFLELHFLSLERGPLFIINVFDCMNHTNNTKENISSLTPIGQAI